MEHWLAIPCPSAANCMIGLLNACHAVPCCWTLLWMYQHQHHTLALQNNCQAGRGHVRVLPNLSATSRPRTTLYNHPAPPPAYTLTVRDARLLGFCSMPDSHCACWIRRCNRSSSLSAAALRLMCCAPVCVAAAMRSVQKLLLLKADARADACSSTHPSGSRALYREACAFGGATAAARLPFLVLLRARCCRSSSLCERVDGTVSRWMCGEVAKSDFWHRMKVECDLIWFLQLLCVVLCGGCGKSQQRVQFNLSRSPNGRGNAVKKIKPQPSQTSETALPSRASMQVSLCSL